MTQTTMRCRVRKTGSGFEGTVYVPGLKPTKLVKKDDTSIYANRSGVASAAKTVASRLGVTLEVEDDTERKKTS